jgi:predicted esterase
MENILELLDENKEYEAYMVAKKIAEENLNILENMFNLEKTIEYSDKENEIIDFFRGLIGSKYKWLYFLLRDTLFYEIREDSEWQNLVNRIKDSLSLKHKEKAIILHENQWTEIKLDHVEHELPEVNLKISFDRKSFKIKAEVKDEHFLDGNRSWRYGDGFFMNFTLPEESEKEECLDTQRFYGLGFSLEEGEPKGVIVNHNGTFYLGSVKELTPKIKVDKEKMIAKYDIKIPFDFLKPFNPLVDEISGLYIRYVSQIDKISRKVVALIEDNHADSEMTNYRRFVPVTYKFSPDSSLRLAGQMDNRLIIKDQFDLKLYFYVPDDLTGNLVIQILDDKDEIVEAFEKSISLNKGKNILSEKIKSKNLSDKLYKIKLIFNEETWEQTFFKYHPKAFDNLKEKIQSLEKIGDTPLISNSIHSLNFKLELIEQMIKEFHPRDDPKDINDAFEDLINQIEKCIKDKSIFKTEGYLRSAIKSPFDDSLQPYSFRFPKGFDLEKENILLVIMHGSGVDEVGFIRYFGARIDEIGFTNLLLVAPRGRHLSDNWIGQSENDTVDIITEVKKMFKIKTTLIMGFSMGGYGTWRMTFKHPELFEGAIVAAGFPHFDGKAENDMRNFIGSSKNIDYLVIHGTADRSVTIESTDEFIETLKKEDYTIEYHRLEGQDHGNLDMGEIIAKWLMKYVK